MITKKAKLFNVLKNIYIKRDEPVSLIHFLTNRCNARCSFCFIDFDDENTFKGELSLNEIDKLTKNLGNSLLNVNFTGGEPFARKEINEIAKKYIDNTSIQSIYVTTNGSLPDRVEKFAREITDYDDEIELTFQISIDDLPEAHDRVRKIKNLYNKCIETYELLKNIKNCSAVVSITVTHENCENIEEIFNHLHIKNKINNIKCTIVRDEGVYKTPIDKKIKILEAYTFLTDKIKNLSLNGNILNYNSKTLQGRLHRKKDFISWKIIKDTYLKPKYISMCHAGGLFGIIKANGDVYPCEILEEKKIGNVRDCEYDFISLWKNEKNNKIKKFIKDTKCNCSYECALSYNILGNYRYQHSLLKSAFNLD